MFTYFLWFQIETSNEGGNMAQIEAAMDAIKQWIHESTFTSVGRDDSNLKLHVDAVNGVELVTGYGNRNHVASTENELMQLIQLIADKAPYSYGMLYTRNEEGPEPRTWKVTLLKKGTISHRNDTFFSPTIPEIEDDVVLD